ncbi:CRISPR-associated protein Cas4 [Bacillus cytotoxicus]|uniref:CRISPR-associated protein Cas4 n=1 Tax=Bacillus cytotoxicus TaxID=580165 RepID=UPI000660A8D3|nr:CRISPR-associated protein Cas4 [Bacillus cytotoxicus]AWC32897.1 CRISPR-associated protein Cas4 [Bacillus cytotoxicus]AWC36921.1 CRISPR-associated protein Cas4 [Bacillus cytotoxicus]AWC61184.1 CRISPR-associated protein Cas4 [Bacillus cytotoxicus]KMT48367.1 CRISPR-associated protein Cas4 [Bacillus cytotoxicus]HDR7309703.1 CRISPR-associated protein Cas4 [Bacillus cytotoxicus]
MKGTYIHYYFVCHRKLWLFVHQIQLEIESERVIEGKILHDSTYQRMEHRELDIDGVGKIDGIEGEYIREIKLTSKMQEADRWQLLYYLAELKKRGVTKKGLLSYKKEKRTEEVHLTEANQQELENIQKRIQAIILSDKPPKLEKKKYCSSCAYYDFCFSGEGEGC